MKKLYTTYEDSYKAILYPRTQKGLFLRCHNYKCPLTKKSLAQFGVKNNKVLNVQTEIETFSRLVSNLLFEPQKLEKYDSEFCRYTHQQRH